MQLEKPKELLIPKNSTHFDEQLKLKQSFKLQFCQQLQNVQDKSRLPSYLQHLPYVQPLQKAQEPIPDS